MPRRRFVTGTIAGGGFMGLGLNPLKLLANNTADNQQIPVLRGNKFDFKIGYRTVNFTGQSRSANAVNGSIPAPTLHLKQGQRVTLNVTNYLVDDSSIHWHGLILPNEMDGVPGLTFNGIKPGENYLYD